MALALDGSNRGTEDARESMFSARRITIASYASVHWIYNQIDMFER